MSFVDRLDVQTLVLRIVNFLNFAELTVENVSGPNSKAFLQIFVLF